MIDQLLAVLTYTLISFGTIALAAVGLAIIFGMMGIINLAHGEFIMIGAYGTALSYHAGVPLIIAILLGGVATAVFGVIAEAVIIRHLYERLIDSMVATWGLGLILIQSFLIVFGPSSDGIPIPFESTQIGSLSVSTYQLLLGSIGIALFVTIYVVYAYTEYGLRARATMQDDEMSEALGTDISKMYRYTFAFGAFLSGLAGGLFAPLVSISPNLGSQYIIEAFVTVITGGTNVLIGAPIASLILSGIYGTASNWSSLLIAKVALLLTAIMILRILPDGITQIINKY
jgi:branched-chain amino acid transport system permease protein